MPQLPLSDAVPGTRALSQERLEGSNGEVFALRRELQRLRILAETAPAILLDRDLEKGTVWWNAAAYEMFGAFRQQAESDPKWWVERVHPDDRPMVTQKLHALTQGRVSTLRIEMKMRAGDGSYRTFDAGFTGLTATGETNDSPGAPPVRLVVAMRDITPQRRAEQQRDRLFTLSPDLLAVIGMDGRFRQLNPAWEAALGIPLERLQTGRFTDLVHPDDAPTAFRQLRNIVSGMPPQDFECRCIRPEGMDDRDDSPSEPLWYSFRVRPELAHGNFHLRGKEITFAKQALEAAIASKNAANLAREMAVGAKETAEAASNELASRLLQLQADSRAAAARILELTPKLLAARLPGVQQLYVDQIEGASRGLRQTADQSSWEASIPTAAKRPTAQSLTQIMGPQPVSREAPSQPELCTAQEPARVEESIRALATAIANPTLIWEPPTVDVAPPATEQPPKRILVVEDNKVNQKVAAGLLKNLGYTTELAADGIEALAALENKQFDLVLMDCQMPEMDGFTATQELRRREQAIQAGESQAAPESTYAFAAHHRYARHDVPHIPVIAVTAHALSGDRERCLSNGMDDYLMKPINASELRAIIEKTLAQVAQIADAIVTA